MTGAPRLSAGSEAVLLGDRLVIVGGPVPAAVRGSAAAALRQVVLAMDGQRDAAGLADICGQPLSLVTAFIGRLRTMGALAVDDHVLEVTGVDEHDVLGLALAGLDADVRFVQRTSGAAALVVAVGLADSTLDADLVRAGVTGPVIPISLDPFTIGPVITPTRPYRVWREWRKAERHAEVGALPASLLAMQAACDVARLLRGRGAPDERRSLAHGVMTVLAPAVDA